MSFYPRFAVLALLATFASGVSLASPLRFVPLNWQMYRLYLPDGGSLVFLRDDDDPDLLVGEQSWIGQLDGDRATLVLQGEEQSAPKAGYKFEFGRPVLQVLDGCERKLDPREAAADGSLESLWPRTVATEEDKSKWDIWKGNRRLRFGKYGNPNTAAACFLELTLPFFALVFCRRRRWALLGAAGTALGSLLLFMTLSRGGFLALLCGFVTLAAFGIRSLFSWRKLMGAAFSLAVLAGILMWSGAGSRFTSGLVSRDESSDSRLVIWRAAPAMMAAAPGGWGFGMSGFSYNNWFESMDRGHAVGTLFNSHLDVLVEGDWFVRIAYLTILLAVSLLLLQFARRGGSALPLAMWLSFAVSCCFNPLGVVPWLWPLPIGLAVDALLVRRRLVWRRCAVTAALSLAVCLLALGGMWWYGVRELAARNLPRLCSGHGRTVVGEGEPKIWIADDRAVLDGSYNGLSGKEVRSYFSNHDDVGSLGFVYNLSALPKKAEKAVFVGKLAQEFIDDWKRNPAKYDGIGSVVFLSPSFAAADVPEDLLANHPVSMIQGEFAFLATSAPSKLPKWLRIVRGAELYIPGWLDYIM